MDPKTNWYVLIFLRFCNTKCWNSRRIPTTDYTYEWFKDNVLLPNENNYTLDVNQEGTYTVEVTTVLGCSRIRTIKVTASDIASITSIDVDLADTNTVTVNVTGDL
jgi:hypothetical protein